MSQLLHEEPVELTVKYLLLHDSIGRDADKQSYWSLIYRNKPDEHKAILDQEFCKESLAKVQEIRESSLWRALE